MASKQRHLVIGPTFDEMLHPDTIDSGIRTRALAARQADPLDPINLFNITWRGPNNQVYFEVIPPELTGVEANIVAIYGKDFPTGSHKVGAAYSVLVEKELRGAVDPSRHTLVWPSTGNYGIGGAWVGCRMDFDSVVVLPELMSAERFQQIESYGARVIKTPGSESNVKEIYDKTWELRQDPKVRVLNQFEEMGNYRFHYWVTGNTLAELAAELAGQGIGSGRIDVSVAGIGSAGTIALGDRLKQLWPDHKVVGLEPVQCPTLYWNGYGSHDIQGIGDKHVTWIHNVWSMDAVVCVDDVACKKALQLLVEEPGRKVLERQGVPAARIEKLARIFGISGVANVLGAIKMAKFYGLGREHVVATVLTDNIERYWSVMEQMTQTYGRLDETEAAVRLAGIFHGQGVDWIKEGTRDARHQWHNLKYFTWVEQQGKTVEELDAQRDPGWWAGEQAKVAETNRLIGQAR